MAAAARKTRSPASKSAELVDSLSRRLPNRDASQRILARRQQQIDRMAEKVETAIDRLTEYRTALITAATTGKIDVRNVKIPQPAA